MLTALNEEGHLVCLADTRNQQSLQKLKIQHVFYCPECKEKVILKAGTKKITHFAHYRESTCCGKYENESEYHLSGKLKLYLWLKRKGLEPELEAYDSSIGQRPDISFVFMGKKIAVEYQCSVITEDVFKKRTKTYLENMVTPLWILGGNQFKRKSSTIVTLSDFHYLSIAGQNGAATLPFYCPEVNQFIFVKQVIPVGPRNALADISVKTLETVDLNELINPQNKHSPSIESWRKEINHFKLYHSQKPKSYRDSFLKELYFNHLHLSCLPPEIGLPVPHSIFIRTSTVVWQGFIYLDGIKSCKPGDIISFYSIYQAFKNRVWKKDISLRTLPLMKGDASIAVMEYLQFLTACQYLTKLTDTAFLINQELKPSSNMIEQEQKEHQFYERYQSIFNFFT